MTEVMAGLDSVNGGLKPPSWPLVSIIIATHNGGRFLNPCLASVFAQSYPEFEVIFVNNASTDSSTELIRRDYPSVRIFDSDQNLGYGGGNNVGAAISKGELLLFLNHDTIVSDDFLTELVIALQADPSIGMAQSKILSAMNPEIVETTGAYLTRTGMWIHSNRWEHDKKPAAKPLPVMGACGTCLLVRRTVFELLGGFDPDFIVYYDDADLSWRAWLAGYQVLSVPSSTIRHWGSGTTNTLPSTFTVYHSFKNRLCSLIKLLSRRDLFSILPVHLLLCLAGAGAYLLRLKPNNSAAVVRGLIWNARELRQTLRKRAAVQRILAGDHASNYRELLRSLPISYFVRTSFGYVAKW